MWEDAEVLCKALKPVAKGGRLLSIASAGGNALALLTLDPKQVLAVDLNPAQLACVDLRLAAFQALDHAGVLAFLGVSESKQRARVYEGLRGRLSPASRQFWDAQPGAIALGAIHAGKLERFLRRYQAALRYLVHTEKAIEHLLSPMRHSERADYFKDHWDGWRWRALNRLAFSKRLMGALGRDPAFFKHASEDVTSGPNRRLDSALRAADAHRNPYLTYHLTGNYRPHALPLFLQPRCFKAIRSRLQRVRLWQGPAELAPGRFHGFNLSNIFEYMDAAQHVAVLKALAKKGQPGARLAYWNLHVDRSCPPELKAGLRPLNALARRLHAQDQCWPYRSFNVDEVRGA